MSGTDRLSAVADADDDEWERVVRTDLTVTARPSEKQATAAAS